MKPFFSHCYVERGVEHLLLAQRMLAKFEYSHRIEIDDYKEVFNRLGQNFAFQKHSPKLILAQKKGHFLYPGAAIIQAFDHKNLHYVPLVFNCLYNCEYCYLQGMFTSGNSVVFVNTEDYFTAVRHKLDELGELYVCLSYDTDLLAIEGITGIVGDWILWGREQKGLIMELRTKSANIAPLLKYSTPENVIVAFSLSPHEIAPFEHKVPSLTKRLDAINQLIERGWQIRLSFEPIFDTPDVIKRYTQLFNEIFTKVNPLSIRDANIDLFRIGETHLKRMRKMSDSPLLHYDYSLNKGLYGSSDEREKELKKELKELLSRFMPKEKIYV